MLTFKSTIDGFSRRLNIIAGIALVMMMFIVTINVLLRAVWQPILGTYEFTGFLAAISITFALAHCASTKGHIAITLLVDRLPTRVQVFIGLVIAILGTGLFAIIAWQSIKYGINIQRIGQVSPATATPYYPFIFAVAFGFLMLAIVLFTDILESIREILK